jgi:hypothetical protein
MIDLSAFLALPPEEVASLVRQAGPQVCVFPINGTRRWFALEHPDAGPAEYVRISMQACVRLFKMLFEHGFDTILSPMFGDELLNRGEEYVAGSLGGAAILETPGLLQFYDDLQVHVRFYGNYRNVLQGTPHAHVTDVLDRVTARTRGYNQRRLFFGFFGTDATETVARNAIQIYSQTGQVPDRRALVTAYYGDWIEKATMFIGFERPAVFDYPLLALGNESLYFTEAPSPYLTENTLRRILYDHLYVRPIDDPKWNTLPAQEKEDVRRYYNAHAGNVLGLGEIQNKVWMPK